MPSAGAGSVEVTVKVIAVAPLLPSETAPSLIFKTGESSF
jgi:hypothetical protein